MQKIFKKILCTLLVVVMCLTSAPLGGFVGLELPEFSVSEWFASKASAASEGYYTYTITDGEATITGVNTSISGDITIPATLGGYSVTAIGEWAFDGCDSLTSVTIPDSVTTIGELAFADCYSLTSIVVDINNFAYSNDSRGVLFNKNKTILIQYPVGNTGTSYTIPDSVTTIGVGAFADCLNLTSVTIGDSVTTIGEAAFASCRSLTSVTIGDSVTSIGYEAFAYCYSLTSIVVDINNSAYSSDSRGVLFNKNKTMLIQYPTGNIGTSYTIPDSVTTIGDDAFYCCDSLTSVTIPDSVTTIGEWAFDGCNSLTSVTIPDSVTTIGDDAFYNCTSLTDVYYQGTEEQWKEISIGSRNECLTGAMIHFLGEGESGNPDEPELDGYRLRLRSDGAYSDSIAVGETISFWTFLSNNGKSVNCERAYAISFDNPGIFEVVDTEITKSSFDVTLKAKKVGTTNMTVSDNVTGAYVTIKLKANNPVDVLTMDDVKKLATEEYGGITTYFYNINGLYINNYSYSENKDGTYNVKMTAYNEKAHYGAVVSYDKNGNIHKFEVINPKDKLPENLWDGLYDSFDYVNYKLDDWFGDTNYTDIGWTQRTPITIEVPEGGYFEITNKYFNEIVFMTNVIDLTIDLAFAVNDLPEIGIKGATVETVKQLFIKIGSKGIEKLCKKIFKEYSKGIGFENIYDVIFDVAELTKEYEVDFFKIITENINYEELIMDSVETVVLSVIAKPVKEVLDGFGYINTLIKCGDFFNSSLASEVAVYTPAEEPYKRESSGVKVTSETPLDPDYVLHSYIINEADDVMVDAKPTIEAMTSNYQMYDITLYKSSQAVQPNSKIKVMIPIPAGYNKNNIQVYWYKADGTLESMNARVQGDYAVFETDHLSYYVLVEEQEIHSHSYEIASTVNSACTETGTITYTCSCGDFYTEVVPATGHMFSEGNSKCSNCDFDRAEGCDCKCHKGGISGFFFKLILFFQKIFKTNKTCACGIAHY